MRYNTAPFTVRRFVNQNYFNTTVRDFIIHWDAMAFAEVNVVITDHGQENQIIQPSNARVKIFTSVENMERWVFQEINKTLQEDFIETEVPNKSDPDKLFFSEDILEAAHEKNRMEDALYLDLGNEQ